MKDSHSRNRFKQAAARAIILFLATSLFAADPEKPAQKASSKPPASALQKQGRGIFDLKKEFAAALQDRAGFLKKSTKGFAEFDFDK